MMLLESRENARSLHPPALEQVRAEIASGKPLLNATLAASGYEVSAQNIWNLHQKARLSLQGAGLEVQPLLDDPQVTDVLINGTDGIWVDRGGGLERVIVNATNFSAASVRKLAVRLAAASGQRLDDACPIADGTLPDGTRLNAVLPPLSPQGALISLRTHRQKTFTLESLASLKMFPPDTQPILEKLITTHANVFISGATGSGKTTLLAALLNLVDPGERLICLEESVELEPTHPHVVHLTIRRPNVQNLGEVTMSDLVKTAMRMRPDRLILGECRGSEVRDVLTALNTGHEGGWATIHANSALDVPARLTALGALAGMSEETVSAQASSAINAILHLTRLNGQRRLAQLAVLAREGPFLRAHLALDISRGQTVYGPGWPVLARRLGIDAKDVAVSSCTGAPELSGLPDLQSAANVFTPPTRSKHLL